MKADYEIMEVTKDRKSMYTKKTAYEQHCEKTSLRGSDKVRVQLVC